MMEPISLSGPCPICCGQDLDCPMCHGTGRTSATVSVKPPPKTDFKIESMISVDLQPDRQCDCETCRDA